MSDEYDKSATAGAFNVGDAGPELVVEDLERKDFVKYAGASGDFNPLHYDEPYAKATGNESVFGQGMLTAGYVARMVTDWVGLNRVSNFSVRFQTPVWPGDTITVTGEVTDVVKTDDGETVTADLVASNQDNETVVTGTFTATLPAAEQL
jgi:acyl dehydratase